MAPAAGHNNNYALAAVLERNGAGAPIFFDPPVWDITGSRFTVVAILAALQVRMQSGRRCEIDLALADVGMPPQLACLGAAGHASGRQEICLNGDAASYRIYKSREGAHVGLGALERKLLARFLCGRRQTRVSSAPWEADAATAVDRRGCRLFRLPRLAGEAAPDPGRGGPRRLRRS